MANSTNRDVKMTLSVETLGEDGVKALQASIQRLANEGGAAAPEFQRLADEIGRLGAQGAALQNFQELLTETDQLRAKQEAAAASTADLKAKLDALATATDAARAAQREAAQAVTDGQQASIAAGTAIRVLKTEYDNAGKQTDEYRVALKAAVQAQGEARATLIELRDAQRSANVEASAAASEQSKAERAYNRAANELNSLTAALAGQDAALRDSAAAAQQLGVATEDVAGSQARLISAMNAAGAEAEQRNASIRELAESDRLLAIEEQALAGLYARGAAALQAETLAQRDAARSTAQYEATLVELAAAREKALADSAAWQVEADRIVGAATAAQKMQRQTELLVEVNRELAAQRAFAKQAEDARKLFEAAEYAQFWTQELNKAEAATREVQAAFNTLNVRSAEAIRADIEQVRAALVTMKNQAATSGESLAGAFASGQAKIEALELELRQLNGTLTTADRAAQIFRSSLSQIAAGNLAADAVGYLVNKVKEMGREFLDAIVQIDQMRRGLDAIYKNATTTASQIDFLRKTSSDAGVSFSGLSKEFVKFSASMQGANIPLDQTNALFKAVVQASATLGLSAEETAGSLNALGQMASKGVVSMEELRQQLGDRLPGAFGLVAKGFGITEAELTKLVESGGLAARDLFPALTRALGEMKGETDGLVPTFERFKGVLTEVSQGMADAGVTQVLVAALKLLGGTVATVALGLSTLVEGFFLVAKGGAALASSLSGNKNAMAEFSAEVEKSRLRLTGQANAFNALLDPANAATAAQQRLNVTLVGGQKALTDVANATVTTANAQKLQADAVRLAGDANLDLSAKLVQFNLAAAEALKKQETLSEAATKSAKAVKIEGEALIQLTALRGSDRDSLEAGVKAAEDNVVALNKVAESHKAELEILKLSKQTTIEVNAERGITADKLKTELDALDKKIIKAQAEVEQSRASADAAKNEAAARNFARIAYEDNTKSLEAFRSVLAFAEANLNAVKIAMQNNAATATDLANAERLVAQAKGLVNDALRDSITRIKAESDVKQANYNVTLAGLNVQVQAYQQMANAAKSSNALTGSLEDLASATYYEVEAKKIQIQITRLTAEAKSKESQATILAANAELEALKSSNSLTEVKRLEIEARIANAKAKAIEAGASADIIRALELEIATIRNNAEITAAQARAIGDVASARQAGAPATDAEIARTERLNDVMQRQIDLYGKVGAARAGKTSDGLPTNKDGSAAGSFNNLVPVDQAYTIVNKSNAGTLTAADLDAAQAAVTQAKNAKAFLDSMLSVSPSSVSTEAINSTNALLMGAQQALAKVQGLVRLADTTKATANTAKSTSTATTGGTSTSHTVTINVGGKSQTVNVASDADATNLTSLLRSLETASTTASR